LDPKYVLIVDVALTASPSFVRMLTCVVPGVSSTSKCGP
jgi:hypothetical protein